MKHITPIIHMTNECNLGCKYCYTGSAFMSLSKQKSINERFVNLFPSLTKFLDELVVYNQNIDTKIILHGGEPLLITIENWHKLIKYIKDKEYPITFGVQSNGSLINNEYIEMFKKYGFEIGISLDGDKELNDITRTNKVGGSSFPKIFKNLLRLKSEGLKFGVLVTLNKFNFKEIERIYEFFKEHQIPFSIRPIFQTSYFENGNFQLTPLEYGEAFCKLFDLWFNDDNVDPFLVNEFTSIIAQFTEPIEGLVSCNFTKKCSEHFVSFDLDGEVSPCNRFYGEESLKYGNINSNTLEELVNSKTAKPLAKRWEKLAKTECKTCEVKEYCYGGCPANSFYFKDDYFAKDYYCDAYKMIYKHVNKKVSESINA